VILHIISKNFSTWRQVINYFHILSNFLDGATHIQYGIFTGEYSSMLKPELIRRGNELVATVDKYFESDTKRYDYNNYKVCCFIIVTIIF